MNKTINIAKISFIIAYYGMIIGYMISIIYTQAFGLEMPFDETMTQNEIEQWHEREFNIRSTYPVAFTYCFAVLILSGFIDAFYYDKPDSEKSYLIQAIKLFFAAPIVLYALISISMWFRQIWINA